MSLTAHDIVARLVEFDGGWRGPLPPDAGTFFGHSLGVEFETMPVRGDGGPPRPLPVEVELLEVILAALPGVLARAEREFLTYTRGSRAARQAVSEPQVFISRDDTDDDPSAGRWTLWVHTASSTNPAFAYHIEFARTEFTEIWSGD